ncbi:TPA: tRNA (adenosine(37)-N6)-dimethylallyltransferase MiaA [bacterium]|nr:tRNA (adenosine(37)-N6)-dimethylallyltransferase MiaA [bacterium]
MPKIPEAIVITGPTGAGKTKLGHYLALKYNGEIVCCDSRTVYRYMDIGTSKPSKSLRNEVTYHILDVVNPDELYTVARFLDDAKISIENILKKGKIPFIVGGCGLYIRALTRGFFPSPPPSYELREMLSNEENLWERLASVDKEQAEKINPNDKKRLIRALEIFYQIGKPISFLQREKTKKPLDLEFTMFCLDIERTTLYKWLDERVDKMVKDGLADETKRLLSMGYHPSLISMEGIGYREMVDYLKKRISLDDAINIMKKRTRNLAKRQLTWFRNDKGFLWRKMDEIEKDVSITLNG